MQRKSTTQISHSLVQPSNKFNFSPEFTLCAAIATTGIFLSLFGIAGAQDLLNKYGIRILGDGTKYFIQLGTTDEYGLVECIREGVRKSNITTLNNFITANMTKYAAEIYSTYPDVFYRETDRPINSMIEDFLLRLYRACANADAHGKAMVTGLAVGMPFAGIFTIAGLIVLGCCIHRCCKNAARARAAEIPMAAVVPNVQQVPVKQVTETAPAKDLEMGQVTGNGERELTPKF